MSSLSLEGVYTGAIGPIAWAEERTPPAGWQDSTNNPLGAWEATAPNDAPYDAVFEIRSSLTNYQQGTLTVTMSLTLFEMTFPGDGTHSLNIVGYCNFAALVPCLPEQQDASPNPLYTNITYSDMVIRDLVRDSSGIHGVTFTNSDFVATYLLEASRDLNAWSKVAYFYGQPGFTTWTTNTDLGQWGNFFRLDYVGYGELDLSLLPPLDPPSGLAAKSLSQPIAVTATSKPVPQVAFGQQGRLKVRLSTTPGRNYLVRVYDAGKVVWTTQCAASQSQTVMDLPAAGLPRMGIIRADELP